MKQLEKGEIFADVYEILAVLGTGANGAVYLADDRQLNRPVAIKLLHIAAGEAGQEEHLKRFAREAKVLSQISDPNIVSVYRFGFDPSGNPYLVMEYVKGRNLRQLLESEKTLSLGRATYLIRQILSGLKSAHERGIVHRDLKPDNILLSVSGEVEIAKIADFGLSQMQKEKGQMSTASLTETGIMVGTAPYMSPEQCLGRELDQRTDLYSLGCIYFELLTGKPPFWDESIMSLVYKHVSDPPPRLLDIAPQMPLEVDEVLQSCLAKDPAKRMGSCQEMAHILEEKSLQESTLRISQDQLKSAKKSKSRTSQTQSTHHLIAWVCGIAFVTTAACLICLIYLCFDLNARGKVILETATFVPSKARQELIQWQWQDLQSKSLEVESEKFLEALLRSNAYSVMPARDRAQLLSSLGLEANKSGGNKTANQALIYSLKEFSLSVNGQESLAKDLDDRLEQVLARLLAANLTKKQLDVAGLMAESGLPSGPKSELARDRLLQRSLESRKPNLDEDGQHELIRSIMRQLALLCKRQEHGLELPDYMRDSANQTMEEHFVKLCQGGLNYAKAHGHYLLEQSVTSRILSWELLKRKKLQENLSKLPSSNTDQRAKLEDSLNKQTAKCLDIARRSRALLEARHLTPKPREEEIIYEQEAELGLPMRKLKETLKGIRREDFVPSLNF